MKPVLSILIMMFALLCCAISLAESPRYHVELIVFSHINQQSVNSEAWPIIANPGIDFARAMQLNPLDDESAALLSQYSILPREDLKLDRIARSLMAANYKVMLHIAWYQSIGEPHSARSIHIFGGTGYDDAGRATVQNTTGNATYNQAAHWQVDGLLRLSSMHYINSSYDFAFAAPTAQIQGFSTNHYFAKVSVPLIYFKLNQSRRMRSDELNYISHPLYGILINITKLNSQKG